MTAPDDLPAHDRLADPYDERDWDVERDGRMREHATEDEPLTIPWEG